MKKITGLKIDSGGTIHGAMLCSEVMADCFGALIKDYPITYSQILYPYVDALSLTDIKGTEGAHIFGTHSIYCDISSEMLMSALNSAIDRMAGKCKVSVIDLKNMFNAEIFEFDAVDGAVRAEQISEFMQVMDIDNSVLVGNFCDLLGGYLQHWQIRESARIFASFVEMSYRKSQRKAFALAAGRLAISSECEYIDEVKGIYVKKTGCQLK